MFSPTTTMTSPSPDQTSALNHTVAPLDLVADADAYHARQMRIALQDWLCTAGVDRSLRDDLALAVYEALANVVEHAYPPDHPHPIMRLRARKRHHDVVITITDHGRWRPPSSEASYRGRGLTVMRALATYTDLQRTAHGTTVQLAATQG
jgi:anti-sigma regulatory factor (Ser/Thr protein kinase)